MFILNFVSHFFSQLLDWKKMVALMSTLEGKRKKENKRKEKCRIASPSKL